MHAQRRGGAQLVGNAPAAQVLAGAHIRRLGARGIAHTVIALHQQAADAAVAEFYGQRQANGAGAYDEDLNGFHGDFFWICIKDMGAIVGSGLWLRKTAKCAE